jgi:CheY-like chemotaxis protein
MEQTKLKILAIDDKPDNLTVLKAVLADALPGARVFTALSGEKGIELAQQENPDVILLDIIMPGLDGFETCRRLKAEERTRTIPVVFLTAIKTSQENRIKALEAGGEGFLPKPLEETELIAQVKAMAKLKAAAASQAEVKAYEALKDSEAKYRGLIERTGTGYLIIDAEGRVADANPEYVRMSGHTALEQIKGRSVIEWTAPYEKEKNAAAVAK